jgi:hypothetical protein
MIFLIHGSGQCTHNNYVPTGKYYVIYVACRRYDIIIYILVASAAYSCAGNPGEHSKLQCVKMIVKFVERSTGMALAAHWDDVIVMYAGACPWSFNSP